VDQEEFLERANTIQFLVKAERFPDNIAILSKVEHQARVNERLPGPTVTIIACCNESAPITNEFIESIAKARTAFCAPMLLVADDATGETMSTDLNAKAQKHDWMQIVRFDNPIGISRSRNWAVGHTDCEYLVFLEGSTVVQAGWLEHLLEVIQDKKVGIVGSQLLYGDGTISQVGIAFTKDAHTQHLFRGYDQNDVRLRNPMEIPAITASCMLINRELFQQLQGFSLQYPDFLSELDLCFKVRQKGLTVVYHPGSKVVQSKLVEAANLHLSDQQQDIDRAKFLGKWREMMQKDSLANPSFYSAGRGYQLIKP
jgi:GT2 family glycosyltransferase